MNISLPVFKTDFFFVVMITLSCSVFKMLSSLHENPTVFATLVSVLILYILVVVWCRRKDRRDEKKVSSIIY